MLDSKFFITLIGLAVVLFAVSSKSINPVTENFMNYPRMALASNERCTMKNGCKSQPPNYNAGLQKFYSTPAYQAVLAPRMMSPSYGVNIRYNPPSEKHLALKKDNPLTFSNMAKCNYTENFEPQKSKQMSYNQALQEVYKNDPFENLSNGITEVDDMSAPNAMGQNIQTFNYDRLIYSTGKSRLTGLGDPIRGDLPIIPNACGWFSPAVNPARDLTTGAINVIAGDNNETSMKLAQLRMVATDNSATPSGGTVQNYPYITQQAMQNLNNINKSVYQSQQRSVIGVDNNVPLFANKTAVGFA
jgi:hypothetical protein